MCTLCIRCRALDMLTGIRSSDQSDRHCIISSQSVSEVSVEFPNFLQFSLVRRPAARAQLCVACDPNYSRVTTTKPPTQSNTMPQYSYKFFCYPFSIFLFLPRFKVHIALLFSPLCARAVAASSSQARMAVCAMLQLSVAAPSLDTRITSAAARHSVHLHSAVGTTAKGIMLGRVPSNL